MRILVCRGSIHRTRHPGVINAAPTKSILFKTADESAGYKNEQDQVFLVLILGICDLF
jgi:hypothetical protein